MVMVKGVWLNSDLWGETREEMVPELEAELPELPAPTAAKEEATPAALASICWTRCYIQGGQENITVEPPIGTL